MTRHDILQDRVIEIIESLTGHRPHGLLSLRPGSWASAFAFESDNGPRVIRFSHNPDDFARDAYAARFRSPVLPIPEVTHRGESDGVHVAISERILDGFLDDLDGEGFRATTRSLIAMLDALRTANVSDSTGFGIWEADGNGVHRSWKDYLRASIGEDPEDRAGPWRAKLETSTTGAAAFDRDVPLLLRRIEDMPEIRGVIHGDLLNYNVFASDGRITGVIDWGCAMYGDPLFDLAWFDFWWPWYPQWRDIDIVAEAARVFEDRGADMGCFRERLRCYELQIGLTHQAFHAAIESWDMLEAVTRRTTAIADEIR